MRSIPFILFVLFTLVVEAQSPVDLLFNQIQEVDTLPPDIRSGKSLVLTTVDRNDEKEFERVSELLHKEIIRSGIDPVVYYNVDLVFGGWDITRAFIDDFNKRELQNIIIIDARQGRSRIAVTDFSAGIFSGAEFPAWVRTGDLKTIANQLYVSTANSRKPLENLLISETPERGFLTDPIQGKRAEYFSLSMDGLKIAVPRFGNTLKDQELHAIMQKYFGEDFELVDNKLSDEDLLDQGFQFILRSVQGTASDLRAMLEYEEEEGVTAYVSLRYNSGTSQAFTHSQSDHIYKFYFNHVRSGTTYLGAEWDVDLTWKQALINHLESLKKFTSG